MSFKFYSQSQLDSASRRMLELIKMDFSKSSEKRRINDMAELGLLKVILKTNYSIKPDYSIN